MTPGRPLSVEQRALLERLVREAAPRVHAYVRRAFPRVDPDEALAETFFRAAQAAPGLERSPDPVLYLLRTARTVCLRSLQRPATAEIAGDPPAREEAVPSADLEEMLRAVAELPDAQREVVVLRISVGLSFEQVAEMLGIPLGTALSRMHAAQRRLRELLGVKR